MKHHRRSLVPVFRPDFLLTFFLSIVLFPPLAQASDEKGTTVIEEGKRVSIEYTLTLGDGTRADSNVGGEPLVYTQGEQQILPALESALAGLAVGDTKDLTLPPEQGYGLHDSELVHEVEKEMVPEEARKPGTRLVSENEDGNRRMLVVLEVREETVLLDFNHPLAGQTLHFVVTVVRIE